MGDYVGRMMMVVCVGGEVNVMIIRCEGQSDTPNSCIIKVHT